MFIVYIDICYENESKNQVVVISGILVLLATATIAAASYVVQPAKAVCNTSGAQPFGKCVSGEAGPSFGPAVSGLAHANNAGPQHNGLQQNRASGCANNQFGTVQHDAHDVCPP
jgi:hypothetical protein